MTVEILYCPLTSRMTRYHMISSSLLVLFRCLHGHSVNKGWLKSESCKMKIKIRYFIYALYQEYKKPHIIKKYYWYSVNCTLNFTSIVIQPIKYNKNVGKFTQKPETLLKIFI